MVKIEYFIEELNKRSNKPIKNVFNMTLKGYINDEKEIKEKKLATIYDETMYYYLTDFMDGIEDTVLLYGYEKELNLLKDVIAIDSSEKSKKTLVEYAKNIRLKINDVSVDDKNAIERFVWMLMSYSDERAINKLVENLLKSGLEDDNIIQFVNKRIIANKTNILKL